MGAALLTPNAIRAPLRECGYRSDLIKADFPFGDLTVPLMGFAQPPADSRSACVAVISAPPVAHDVRYHVERYKGLGTPLVFVCFQDDLQWWKQGTTSAQHLQSIPAANVDRFFEEHKDQFSPEIVYRAKTWGRYRTADQLSFVDLGLMPLVEQQVGASLAKLVERNVSDVKDSLSWQQITEDQGHWLLKAVFWLLSGKILRDKEVDTFEDLDLLDVEDVFRRVAKHYGTDPVSVNSKKRLDALGECARDIDRFSSLALTTTESLAYVYENALISKATRAALGTHSTPPFLVDYIVGNLTDWVNEIPVNDRRVFEPACGQAAFLVSAMRLLTEMLPPDKRSPSRRGPYLRTRLHGTDIDPFALELARLSLTLTDIPNPDGWDLTARSMFSGHHLGERAKEATILLANPPFQNFKGDEPRDSEIRFVNKSAEMLWRTASQLPAGAVFGVVVPQTLLHSDNARDLRVLLAREYELKDICLFPDKVFSFSDAESAVIMGRRRPAAPLHTLSYVRIRERDLTRFRSDPSILPARSVPQARFSDNKSVSFRLPELEEVWITLAANPILADFAAAGKGLEYRANVPAANRTYSNQRFPGSVPGFSLFASDLCLHETPEIYWMNLAPEALRRAGDGTTLGVPQILMNYAPTSRGPWRLKALIDRFGRPATSTFILVRPNSSTYSLELLWALLNSPVANAYAFSHLGKRHNIVRDIRKIPMPAAESFERLQAAASAYLTTATSPMASPAQLRRLLLRVDCEVLRLYALPPDLETALLAVFTDYNRLGVPFTQQRYLPAALDGRLSFAEFLELDEDWVVTNRERGILIDKSISGTLTAAEHERLDRLQIYADYHIEQVAPHHTQALDEIEKRLSSNPPVKGSRN